MKNIRQNVFETNSSSTHSVSIAYGDKSHLIDIPKLDENGNINIESGEYGWEMCTYKGNVQDRLSYAATYALNYDYSYDDEEDDKKFNYENNNLLLLTEVIKEYTGANEVIYDEDSDDGWSIHGYIDHQSTDEAATIFESKESLESFLFNPKSFFITDNDNH